MSVNWGIGAAIAQVEWMSQYSDGQWFNPQPCSRHTDMSLSNILNPKLLLMLYHWCVNGSSLYPSDREDCFSILTLSFKLCCKGKNSRWDAQRLLTSIWVGTLCRQQVTWTTNGHSSGCISTPAAWAQVGWYAVGQRPWEHCTQQPDAFFIRFLQ